MRLQKADMDRANRMDKRRLPVFRCPSRSDGKTPSYESAYTLTSRTRKNVELRRWIAEERIMQS